ncbi:LuxR C-terminal-related transcriptional regulator [Pseudactinotalea sp. HY158]|uniref:LuxR C-terminal-related transcriptional regulator n=1 Tax=Pseudactinotalea sp. HY158 TaxID=2654547 RepID=UPI001891FA2C|nr:LuxR C-terminal-related transcriptional regulator [Pseudactinotalea sp. HY158]
MSSARVGVGRRIRAVPHLQFAEDLITGPLESSALVVLRAPRGYGKTSLLGAWLDSGHLAGDSGRRVVYLSLAPGTATATATGFWREVLGALEPEGAITGDGPPVRAALSAALSASARPLTIVLDHLHHVDTSVDAEIDAGLLELLDQHPDLNLVVATRTLRNLEVTGLMSMPTRLIGPGDLKLDRVRSETLAIALGTRLPATTIDRLVTMTDGWPALVRTTLAHGTDDEGGLDRDPTVAAAFVHRVIDDFGDDRIREFLYRTCLLGSFTLDRAQGLVGHGDALGLLRPLHHAGLLHEEVPNTYSYTPAVREALERLAREHRPELVKEVHRHLLEAGAPTVDPARALHHAVLAEEWEVGLDLVERYWNRLVTQGPHALIASARAFPGQYVAASARLRVALTDLEGGVVSTLSGQEWSWPWPAVDDPDGLTLTSRADRQRRPLEQDESVALLQWAIAALFSGDLHAATYACNRARNRGLSDPGPVAALATMGLAVLHLFQGELVQGRRLLEDPVLTAFLDGEGPGPEDDRVWGEVMSNGSRQHRIAAGTAAGIVDRGVRLARAMAAVDSGSPDCARLVGELAEPVYRDLVWMLTVSVRARYATLSGDPRLVLDAANELRSALRYIAAGTLPEAILVHDLMDVLLRAGMVGVARDLDHRTGKSPLALLGRAKLAVAERNYHQAIVLCESIGSWLSLWPRLALERDVVLAGAYHAVGRGQEAAELFALTVHSAQVHGLTRPFGLLPRYVFDALAGADRQAQLLWPDPRTRTSADVSDEAPAPAFTDREAQVLRALIDHGGPVAIAHHLGLSTNTAKTHVRNIYKKLGVSNRVEALRAADRLLTG